MTVNFRAAARTAELSDDGTYRYDLTRRWSDDEPLLTFVMLNPSTADADIDDPTIRRCMGFAHRDGYGGIHVVNLYALRATRPIHLWEHPDPVGPENNLALGKALDAASDDGTPVIAAWGVHARPERVRYFLDLTATEPSVQLRALKTTRGGAPGHPLYLNRDATHTPWPPT